MIINSSPVLIDDPARAFTEKAGRKGKLPIQVHSSIRRCAIVMSIVKFFLLSLSINATNIVHYSVSDSMANQAERLELRYKSISNENNKVRISFELKSVNTPFTVYKAEWINCDSVYAPLEPFSFMAPSNDVTGKRTEWHISLDFPFSDSFDENDVLVLYTDKGLVKSPTSREGELTNYINILWDEYEHQLDNSKENSRKVLWISAVLLLCVIIVSFLAFIIAKRRLIRRRKDIEELSVLMSDRIERNRELEAKVEALYGSRLDTLNMLCNEYFEKRDSEQMKITLYNEVEKYILALRDPKSLLELEGFVNRFLDNILDKVKDQLPELNKKDLIFLTYLYAGFSPRGVCIFTDIKIKNYYQRRSRLRERILASDAPDKELLYLKCSHNLLIFIMKNFGFFFMLYISKIAVQMRTNFV